MKKRLFFSCLVLMFVAGIGLPAFGAAWKLREYKGEPGEPPSAYVANRLIVKFGAGLGAQEAAAIARQHGARVEAEGYGGAFHLLAVPDEQEWRVMEALRRNPKVEYAHPDWLVRVSFVPNDPFYSPYQWNMDNPVYGGIEMEQAWDINLGGSASVIVAVVDTGIAYTNMSGFCRAPDLAGTKFVHGYDFINNDPFANDDEGHGTHVAGTIAQTTHNGIGVAGVAFNTTLMPVKVLGADGSGPISAVASGIRFAADNGARVINMSLGTSAPRSQLTALEDAVKYADSKGVLQVAATGNAGATQIDCPACYDEVIAVSATTYNEKLAYYSNTGTGTELCAPGGTDREDLNGDGYPDMILQNTFNPTTKNVCDFGYWFFAGTSMAAPHVSGVAALLFAQGATGKDQVRQVLRNTAKDLGPAGYDTTFGYGRIHAAAALSALSSPGSTSHVGDLDGSKSVRGNRWRVSVRVAIHDANHNAVAGATVTGTWSGARSGTVSGTTGSDGTVSFNTGNMSSGTSVTFTVNNVTHSTLSYDATTNHDPDGDSNGTLITVTR